MRDKLTNITLAAVKLGRNKSDGGGLTFCNDSNGLKTWSFRFLSPITGKQREMGLGSFKDVTLAQARIKADAARALVAAGQDPVAVKKAAKEAAKAARAALAPPPKLKSFDEVVEEYVGSHEKAWKGHAEGIQWRRMFKLHAAALGRMPVAQVDTEAVLETLKPLWQAKPPTGARLRARIESVIDYGKAMGWRSGENPARLRGHLANLLPKTRRLRKVRHHPALDWREVPAFMAALRAETGAGPAPLELLTLTAARSAEVRLMTFCEVNMDDKLWTIPGARTKNGEPHRVPLSTRAVEILASLRRDQAPEDFVFEGQRRGRPPSPEAFTQVLRRLGREDISPHGMRSAFRIWAAEQARCPREVAEAALAHSIGNETEIAYLRTDLLEPRRKLMQHWADYCQRPVPAKGEAKVIQLHG